jgi:UDP-N-acetylglucosamine--N-acetylmuramyl-(pentapeptide) pyrophosphoryl-undecaprenol N-acetylglucosamine transferase
MPNASLRVVIAGGGTGGHLYPGVAVARELLRRHAEAHVTFVGTTRGLEARVLPREGFELDTIRSRGVKGKSVVDRVRGVTVLPLSLVDAWRILSARRPRIVIGVGGYSSGPVVLLAALRRIPTLVLEQNAVPGLTNRLLAPFVRAAAVTFDSTLRFFGDKAFVSGNPVRAEFLEGMEGDTSHTGGARETTASRFERSGERPPARVLVFGGSQGAHAINVAMSEAAPLLAAAGPPAPTIVHQTGDRDLESVRTAYATAGITADVQPFVYDMGRQLRAADLVVCRAGATTLAELTAAGRPSILIPLPTATDDHQRRNAEAMAAAGASEVLLQSEATGQQLADRIRALAADGDRRAGMASAARRLARPDAARVIVDRVLSLVAAG